MDNAAYFFTGVLAGVAGITLLAVLDNKYWIISGKPTALNHEPANNAIEVRANTTKPKTEGSKTAESNNDDNKKSNNDAAVMAA